MRRIDRLVSTVRGPPWRGDIRWLYTEKRGCKLHRRIWSSLRRLSAAYNVNVGCTGRNVVGHHASIDGDVERRASVVPECAAVPQWSHGILSRKRIGYIVEGWMLHGAGRTSAWQPFVR
jgi:hypothetical protein